MSARTFGIEEEFMMLSPMELTPVPNAAKIREVIVAGGIMPDLLHLEFLASQIEYSSRIFTKAPEAIDALQALRTCLAGAAYDQNVLASPSGLPFNTDGRPLLTKDPRYEGIRWGIRALVKEHQMNGLHVHVGVGSREEGVRALNGVRNWLPTLLAISVNSPFWTGKETGFASWRSILARRWSTTGCPPYFRDPDDYSARTSRIVAIGAARDRGAISWNARLSEQFPTLEIRIFDAQLDAQSTIMLAILSRALVEKAVTSVDEPQQDSEFLDAALWLAARDGLSGQLVNPLTMELADASDVLAALLRHLRAALESTGDYQFVKDAFARRTREGTGAKLQREYFRNGGKAGLAKLFRQSLVETPGKKWFQDTH